MFQVHILDLNASNASELFHILDLNASNASEQFHIIGPQCLQCIRAIDGDDGGGGGDGGGFPRTLESGRSPGPTCPETKYPVRGIPHFDLVKVSLDAVAAAFKERKHSTMAKCTVIA